VRDWARDIGLSPVELRSAVTRSLLAISHAISSGDFDTALAEVSAAILLVEPADEPSD